MYLTYSEALDKTGFFTMPEGWTKFDCICDELQSDKNGAGITIVCNWDADVDGDEWVDCSSFDITLQDGEEILAPIVAESLDQHDAQDFIDAYADKYAEAVKAAHAAFMHKAIEKNHHGEWTFKS